MIGERPLLYNCGDQCRCRRWPLWVFTAAAFTVRAAARAKSRAVNFRKSDDLFFPPPCPASSQQKSRAPWRALCEFALQVAGGGGISVPGCVGYFDRRRVATFKAMSRKAMRSFSPSVAS